MGEIIYKCTITGGGGNEEDGGDFLVKDTPKTITFVCVRQPFFSNRMSGKNPIKINKFYTKKVARDHYEAWRDMKTPRVVIPYRAYMNNGHVARFWEDGSITLYPDQCGIPHYLEKIAPKQPAILN